MNRRWWAVLAVVLAAPASAATPSQVYHPPQGHFVRDLSNQVDSSTMVQLDSICAEVDASGDGQLGVAIVGTTSGMAPRAFATDVFKRWGIGHRGTDDGILLFVALDDHKAEIVLGHGLANCCGITETDSDAVMRDDVVANFKAHRTTQALVDGTNALAALLHRHSAGMNTTTGTAAAQEQTGITDESKKAIDGLMAGNIPDLSPRSWVIDLGSSKVPSDKARAFDLAANEAYADGKQVALFLVSFTTPVSYLGSACEQSRKALHPRHPKLAVICRETRTGDMVISADGLDGSSRTAQHQLIALRDAWLGPPEQLTQAARSLLARAEGGSPLRSAQDAFDEAYEDHKGSFFGSMAFVGFFGIFGLRRWNRYRSRNCEHCGRARQRLGPHSELEHLTEGQQREQELGSVDYDVWWCGVCNDVWINDNVAWFSSYSRCPQCSLRARSSSTTTLEYATEYSQGVVEVKEYCESCNYNNTYTRRTARLSSSSSSSDSSWGSSFTSSDSGGSSFGGGDSGGSGSSGSW
jgi:uncharacterized protein